MQEIQNEKEKKKKKLILLLLIIILCLGCGIWFFMNSWMEDRNRLARERDAQEGFLPGMTADEIQKLMDEKVEEGSVQISINSKLRFKDGTSKGNIRIVNSKSNHYLMVVEIYRKDNNQRIYQSGAMEPGNYLEQARLDVDLDKGDYPVIVKFKNYDLETEDFIGEAQAESVVQVLN